MNTLTQPTLLAFFEKFPNHKGTQSWKLTDDAPDWLRTACMEAHGDEWPNDWRWNKIVEIVERFGDYGIDPPDYDTVYEIADSLVDIYTSDLLTWLAGDNGRVSYVDEVAENYDMDRGFVQLLMCAQCLCIESMCSTLRDAWLYNYLEDDDDN